jgi:hypothetical protein
VTAISEAQGEAKTFRLQPGKDNPLPAGRYVVTAVHPRFAPQTIEVNLVADQTSTITLTLVGRQGSDVNGPGAAMPSAIPAASSAPALATSNAPAVAPSISTAAVEAAPPSAMQAPSTAAAADANGRLRISVWDAEQQDLLNSVATLLLVRESPDGSQSYELAPGRFAALPPGHYQVIATAPNFKEQRLEVDVAAGKTNMLECRLVRAGK